MNRIKNKSMVAVVLCITAVVFFVTALNNETITQPIQIDYGKNVTENNQTVYQTTEVQTTQLPYQIEVTEVRTLHDCMKSSSKVTPCTLIKLNIKSNNIENLEFILVNESIMGKSSTMLHDKVGLNHLCTPQAGMEFVLTENTQRNIGLCYPLINNADEPNLKIETLVNNVSTFDQMKLI